MRPFLEAMKVVPAIGVEHVRQHGQRPQEEADLILGLPWQAGKRVPGRTFALLDVDPVFGDDARNIRARGEQKAGHADENLSWKTTWIGTEEFFNWRQSVLS